MMVHQTLRLASVAILGILLSVFSPATGRAGDSDIRAGDLAERVIRGRVVCRGGLKPTSPVVHHVRRTGERFEVEDSRIRVTPAGELANVAVICVPVGGDGRERDRAPGAPPTEFVIRNRVAVPRVAAARAGSFIQFVNEDAWYYPLRVSKVGGAVTAVLVPPESRSASIPVQKRFGIVRIDCSTNPWTQACLIVADAEVVAVTDEKGAFEVRTRHGGPFELRLWHEMTGWIKPKDLRYTASAIDSEGKKLLIQPVKEATDLGVLEIDVAAFE